MILPAGSQEPEATAPVHDVAPRAEWPWLPVRGRGILVPHPYCRGCGLVKFVGADRALDMGGLANVMGRLGHRLRDGGLHLTEAQRRLVMKRLAVAAADDTFSLSRAGQLDLLTRILGSALGIDPKAIESYLRSC